MSKCGYFAHERGTFIFMLRQEAKPRSIPGQPGHPTLGRTNSYQMVSVLWRGDGCFPGALGRRATCSPVGTHSVAPCLVLSAPRLEGCAALSQGHAQDQGLCSGLFAPVCSLAWQQALCKLPSLPGTLTLLFTGSKHSDPRDWPQRGPLSQCTHP